jgi:hypothetical protein
LTTPWYDGYLDHGADGGSVPIWHAGHQVITTEAAAEAEAYAGVVVPEPELEAEL